jgi:hypothetical protein
MTGSTLRGFVVTAAVTGLALLPATPSLAHGEAGEGDLVLTIGFVNEPAFAGMPNGAQMIVEHDGQPVTDLRTGDVQVEVTFGDETSEAMDFEPAFAFEGEQLVFGEAGDYHAEFVPSQPGRYTFHITGTIDGEDVDEEMTSGPDTFSTVEDVAAASFPAVNAPTNEELATRIDAESSRAADGVAAAEAAAATAESAASSARTVGVVGVVLGAIGIIAAIAAMASARRKA